MLEPTTNIFEKLKSNRKLIQKSQTVETVFFQLNFDETGAYIAVIDAEQKEIKPGYEYFSGHTRDLLKSIEHIKEKNYFRINWDAPADKIYLAENEYLIWQLRNCENLVDAHFKPVKFTDGLAKLIVQIDEDTDNLSTKIVLLHQGKRFEELLFLNESHLFTAGKIYQIPPLSENYKVTQFFQTQVERANFEKYLSLLYSYFENITVRYKKYKQVTGTPRQTQPALIFEKVDTNNSLYLRISTSFAGFDADFLDNYDISKIASLNELEQTIVVSDVLYEEIYSCFDEIVKLLKKYRKSLKDLKEYFVEDNLIIIEENLARRFIYAELTHLITRFAIFGAEKLKSYKIRTVTPTLNLSLSHGMKYLEGDAELDIEGQSISLMDALNQYQKNSYISLNDGTHAVINKEYIQKLRRIFKKQKDKVKVSFFDLPIVEELIDEKTAAAAFKQSREVFLGFNKLETSRVKLPAVDATLRDYQKKGYKWINYLHKNALGGCLADDMGLGKTLQAILLLASIYPAEKKNSLIIMPKSLLFNWENEFKKFKPDLTYYVYYGNQRDLKAAKSKQLILTTYAMIRIAIEDFKEEEFYYIILDESQNIKNINSQISRATTLLKSEHRLALSGTPIENNLGELYSLFRFLNPSMFGSIDNFNNSYAIPIQKYDDKAALHELKKKIYPFILRRLKSDVLTELPEKIEQIIYVDMSAEQKKFYEQRRMFYYQTIKSQIALSGIRKSQFFILQALTELRQIASIPESKSENKILSPKREVLMENLLEVLANDHKVLIFANYLNALDCMAIDLKKNGIEYLHMTGATQNRKELVEKFQNEDEYKVFLMTLKTGGIGLNLTAADYIFIFDPWWNKAAENQAIDRTHRIGQDKTVFSYKLITRETIEEKILKLQNIKSELFESLISSDGASIKSLDEKDVEFVLGA